MERKTGIIWKIRKDKGTGLIRTPMPGVRDHVFLLQDAPGFEIGWKVAYTPQENPGRKHPLAVNLVSIP